MLLNLLAYVIIPIYTILFTHKTNWFTTNFSVIGSLANRKTAFLIWGILVGAFFYYSMQKIIRYLPERKKEQSLVTIAMILLTFAVTTPYLPEDLPFQSFLHVVFAFTASVLLIFCLMLVIWKLYRTDRDAYRSYLTSIVAITVISALLLVIAGIVSSALEVFFTITCTIMVHRLHIKLSKINTQREAT